VAKSVVASGLLALMLAQGAAAEYGRIPPTAIDPAALTIDEAEHLGRRLDGNIVLRGEDGAEFMLGSMLDKPLILVFSYYQCDGACPALNRNLAKTILAAQRFHPGEDYRVLTVSFDRNDGPEQLQHFVHHLELPIEARTGWRYAVVKQAEDLVALTQSVGYKYFWSVRDKVFVHPNVLIFVTPDGRVARYLYGLSASPRDVYLALIEANGGRIAKPSQAIDFLTGICFSYNFSEGRYVLNYPLFIALASLLGGVALVVFSFTVFRHRKPRRVLNA
jgi:protein SCO1/2